MRDAELVELFDDMYQKGFTPLLAVLLNDKEHARVLWHPDVGDVRGFVRWLSFEVADET